MLNYLPQTNSNRLANASGSRARSFTYDGGANSIGKLSYDSAGRIASMSIDGQSLLAGIAWQPFGAPRGWTQGNGRTVSRTFDRDDRPQAQTFDTGSNRLQSASGIDARASTHDTAGNMTAEGGYGFGYDARNRLVLATSPTTSTSYGHDGLGRRVFKSNTSTRYFAHDEQRQVLGEYDAATTINETVWLGTTPVAVLRNGQAYWIDADHIDTPRAVLNASNQVVWRWRSEAFGNTQVDEDPSSLGAFEFNHRFPGQVFDRETALHHNDHRDYRAHTGRYTQSDPIGLAGGINTYAYVGGNPISNVDPMGLLDRLVYDGKYLTGYEDFGVEFRVPAVSGPHGLGRLPEGVYMGSKLQKRTDKAMSCPDGAGWSLNLDPTFKTTRDLLRIHPDGNVPGTLGCIGPSCGAGQQTVHDALRGYFREGWTSIPVIVQYPK